MPSEPELPQSAPQSSSHRDNPRHDTSALLEKIWQKNRPVLNDRLSVLRSALEHIRSDHLPHTLHLEAISVAHKLAGSLGMFGLHAGTDAARELELLLDSPHPPDAAQFALYLKRLEETIASRDTSS